MAQLGYHTSPPDAWGPPGVFARRLHGSTPVQTGPEPLASPDTEEEYVSYFQGRIAASQNRQLLPLQEDLADWLNKILGRYLNLSPFISHVHTFVSVGLSILQ